MSAALPHRARYAPALRRLLDHLDERSLSAPLRRGRADTDDQVFALAGLGLVSSSSRRLGQHYWRLHCTKRGSALRKLLQAEAARA
jgi:hypothetical protein